VEMKENNPELICRSMLYGRQINDSMVFLAHQNTTVHATYKEFISVFEYNAFICAYIGMKKLK